MASNRAVELNGDDDEEASLQRAIAISLGQTQPDLEPAISEVDGSDIINAGTASADASPSQAGATVAPANSMATLGLDRKKMEEERLARLKKRKADTADALEVDTRLPPAQRPRLSHEPAAAESRMPQPSLQAPASSPNSNSHSKGPSETPKASAAARLPYPQGIVRRTWALGVPRGDDIKLEEIFDKDNLELAVLSSFQWDEDWLMSKLNLRKTKVLLVAYAADDAQKAAMRDNVLGDVIRFTFPPMEGGASCMHSKLQLLKYPKFLRVVIPTGNLVPYDWGETGHMENMVFLIDLPRILDPTRRATAALTPFGEELSYFLKAQGVEEKMVSSLANYDFSETARYGFLHTIGGSHPNKDVWQRTGYCGLGNTVQALGLGSEDDIEIDYICSSIGAANNDLLTALYNACKGDGGMKEYEARIGRPRKKSKDAVPSAEQLDFTGHVRVYFPSRDIVSRSRGGTISAGTICFQPKWWDSKSFPRAVLRDCKNVRSGVLMHSKILFVRRFVSSTNGSAMGWAYLGSANLSESAWGRLVKDRNTGRPKLNARNWECGVLIPTSTARPQTGGAPRRGANGEGPQMLDIFRGVIPIPVELPGTPYCAHDELRPWFYQER